MYNKMSNQNEKKASKSPVFTDRRHQDNRLLDRSIYRKLEYIIKFFNMYINIYI